MCSLENRGDIYVLTITGDGDHRLNPALLDSILAALSQVRSEVTAGSKCSALVTTAQGKFFSIGFDLDWARGDPTRVHQISSKLRSAMTDLITLPLPTIAAVTGHASGGGFVLALMRSDRGFLYMSEFDIGLAISNYFIALLGSKVGEPAARGAARLEADGEGGGGDGGGGLGARWGGGSGTDRCTVRCSGSFDLTSSPSKSAKRTTSKL